MSLLFNIHRKPNGQHLRITVEHKPLQTSQLLNLQTRIKSQLLEFTPKDKEYFHLTLLHIGIPQDIFYEARKYSPDLTPDEFTPALNKLLLDLYTYIQNNQIQIHVAAKEVELYGSAKSPAVALKINRNPTIDQLHLGVFSILVDWVAENISGNPLLFIQSSRNFRHSPPENFDPHITLGRVPNSPSTLPQPIHKLNLTIDKPYLAHVTVM